MALDYNKYIKEYHKKYIKQVPLALHKINDTDIIEAIGDKNRQGRIKELIRKGLKNESI